MFHQHDVQWKLIKGNNWANLIIIWISHSNEEYNVKNYDFSKIYNHSKVSTNWTLQWQGLIRIMKLSVAKCYWESRWLGMIPFGGLPVLYRARSQVPDATRCSTHGWCPGKILCIGMIMLILHSSGMLRM